MNNNTTENKVPMRLEVTTTEKFDKLASTTLTTTQKLAKRFNKLFSSVFVDYFGSIIYYNGGNGNVNPNQQFTVELHFKPMAAGSVNPSDDRLRAFKPINENPANPEDVVAGIKNMWGNLRSSSKFELTSEGAQILSEFILPRIDNGKDVDPMRPSSFNTIKGEYIDNAQFGRSPIMVKIGAVDLVKLITKIYGYKTEDGKKVAYAVIPYGPVTPMNNATVQSTANWRILIMQIDQEKTYDLAAEFGIIPTGNGGSVITGF